MDHEVSVRELRQNLSVYLRRVRDGTTLAVTNRGERVAVIAPVDGGGRLERLIAEGRVSAPEAPWIDPTPEPLADAQPVTQALSELRAEERY